MFSKKGDELILPYKIIDDDCDGIYQTEDILVKCKVPSIRLNVILRAMYEILNIVQTGLQKCLKTSSY